MGNDFTVVGNREILLVAETIAHKKGITMDDVLGALEDGLKLAARKKYGHDLAIECDIDRKTGQISLYNQREIISEEAEKDISFNPKKQISLKDAKELVEKGKAQAKGELQEGGLIRMELPPIELSRIIVQIAKNEIIKKVKEAERDKEYNEFKDRVHTLVNGVVKKIGLKNLVVEVDGYEALLPNYSMIPGERFRVNERLRAYIAEVHQERKGAQIFLSRTDTGFVYELFKQEVPEIYDGIIEVKAIAREPGSRVKIAVHSRDEASDVIGACVGVKGSRVQAIMNELNGEKIDIIKWSDSLPELVVNALTPAKISKVIFDDEKDIVEVIVANDQLSLTIGRGGQNVKLASKIIGYKIDIMTEEDERKRRATEFNEASQLFARELDLEEVIGHLLTAEGYDSIASIAEATVEELADIEGFDQDIATEIQNRAKEWLKNHEGKEGSVEEFKEGMAKATKENAEEVAKEEDKEQTEDSPKKEETAKKVKENKKESKTKKKK